jgi:hypothetical protein
VAKQNVFSAKGHKPYLDFYRIPLSEIKMECERILKDKYGMDYQVYIDKDEEIDNKVRISIEDSETFEEDCEKAFERMLNDGMNPTEEEDVQNFFSFELGGGQDAWLEWGNADENDTPMINFYVNPRQDIELSLHELAVIANDSTRKETIKAIQEVIKKVRVK